MMIGKSLAGKAWIRAQCCLLAFLACSLITGCGEETVSPEYSPVMADYWLESNICDSPVYRLTIEISGPELKKARTYNIGYDHACELCCKISTSLSIPTGSGLSILVRAYRSDDVETHRGQVTADITLGTATTIIIPLESLSGGRTLEARLYNVAFRSTFETDTEGWTAWNNGGTDVSWVDRSESGTGETGGCLSLEDASQDSTLAAAFCAPVELQNGADLSGCYGAQLSYWMRVLGKGTWRKQQVPWNVLIESEEHGTLTISFPEALLVDFPYRWQKINLNLSVAPSVLRGRYCFWQINGHRAGEEEIRNVLSSVTRLLICADFYEGGVTESGATTYLDDVIITAQVDPGLRDSRKSNGLRYMCEMPFNRVVFPGNHNAGSCINLHWCAGGGSVPDCSWRNQGKTIREQLDYGIRYLDLDMCGCSNVLVTCHGGDGATGWSFNRILNDIDGFMNYALNRNEVIVITIGDINGNSEGLQRTLYGELERWIATPERLDNNELSIFRMRPGDPWPTLGYLVDSNQRILFFVRGVIPLLEEIGVFSERDRIHDTYRSRGCTSSCSGVVADTRASCAAVEEGKLVLISVMCAYGLCLRDLAGLCDQWISPSLWACAEARSARTGKGLIDVTPNFIVADWTQAQGDIVADVEEMNHWILEENDFSPR